MSDPTRLDALNKATKAAGIAIQIAMKVPAPLKSIADQVIRSASSVPANLAEGHGRSGRDRTHHYRIAYASAKEVDAHVRVIEADRTRSEVQQAGAGGQGSRRPEILPCQCGPGVRKESGHTAHGGIALGILVSL